MGFMTIDGRKVEFTDEKNGAFRHPESRDHLRHSAITLRFPPSAPAGSVLWRMTRGRTFASCSEVPRDGMVIYTNSGRIKKYRKLIVELLLSAHCRDCTTCVKSGECVLQDLAHRMNITDVRFQNTREIRPLDTSSPSIVRDPNKCILCGDCVRACSEIQGLGDLRASRSEEQTPWQCRPLTRLWQRPTA